MRSNRAHVAYFPHPFVDTGVVRIEVASGTSLLEIKHQLDLADNIDININGKHFDGNTLLYEQDSVVIRTQPAGSGTTYNQTSSTRKIEGWAGVATLIGGLVLAIYAPWLGLFVAGVGLGLLAIALSNPVANADERSIVRPNINGASNSGSWSKVPLIIGKNKVAPGYAAAPFTDISVGDDGQYKYINLLFVLGYGPLKISTIQMGDLLIASNSADVRNGAVLVDGQYAGIDIELRQDGSLPTIFPYCIAEIAPNVTLTRFHTLAINVTINASAKTIFRNDTGNWGLNDVLVGDYITISGALNSGNNKWFLVTNVDANTIALFNAIGLVNETFNAVMNVFPASIVVTAKRARYLTFVIELPNGLCTWDNGVMKENIVEVKPYYRVKGTVDWTLAPGWLGAGYYATLAGAPAIPGTPISYYWTTAKTTDIGYLGKTDADVKYLVTFDVIVDYDNTLDYFNRPINFSYIPKSGSALHHIKIDNNTYEVGQNIDLHLRLSSGTHHVSVEVLASDHYFACGVASYVAVVIGTIGVPGQPDTIIDYPHRIKKTTNKTIRYVSETGLLDEGQYETMVIRTTPDNENTSGKSYIETVQWTAVKAATDRPVWGLQTLGKVVLMAMRIRASNQIANTVSKINMLLEGIYPAYDGGGTGDAHWPSTVTQNIAAAMLWLIRGPFNPRPVTDITRFDWAALEQWALNCDAEGLKANGVITSSGTAKALLTELCAIGRGSFMYKDGLISVAEDRTKTALKQLITPRNSWGFSWTKSFADIPHGIKYTYINANADYVSDTRIVLDDGYVYDVDNSGELVNYRGEAYGVGDPDLVTGIPYVLATKFEAVNLSFTVTADEVYKQGRYTLAVRRLRPTTFTVNMDWEQLSTTRGDKVGVSHDSVSWGYSQARVKSVTVDGSSNILTITFDEPISFVVGTTYRLRYRTVNNVYSTTFTVPATDVYTTITPTTPIPAANLMDVDTLMQFGLASIVYSECIIVGIKQNVDYSAQLTLVEYNAAIYSADTGSIPAHEANTTKSPFVSTLPTIIATSENISASPPNENSVDGLGTALVIKQEADAVFDNNIPPSNNVTNIKFSARPNGDGSIDIEFEGQLLQGDVKADGILLYYKEAASAPGPIDYVHDPYIYIPLQGDN